MSDHISVLSDQNGDLVGHMPFQGRKIICSPGYQYLTTDLNPSLRYAQVWAFAIFTAERKTVYRNVVGAIIMATFQFLMPETLSCLGVNFSCA